MITQPKGQTVTATQSKGVRFRATLDLSGRTATGIVVPPELVTALGPSKRPAVLVTIGAHTYSSTVAPMRGRFMVPVSAENRGSAGVSAGDEVEVRLELDTTPREVAVRPTLPTRSTETPRPVGSSTR
jgi:Domain of unknown function (DUF1905)